MKLWLLTFWDTLRATLWFVPTAMTLAAIALSFLMISVDASTQDKVIDRIGWVWAGGPEGARAVLSTIAGSMIGVAGVTFSITIVALSLASSQFGPRLLRDFMRDTGNLIVLGTFIATFVYCLLVLRTVRGDNGEFFVPHFSITLGLLLAVASLGVLIYFVHHVSVSIQAPEVIALVAQDLEAALDRLFPEQIGDENSVDAQHASRPFSSEEFPHDASPLLADADGYLQAINTEQLMELAKQRDIVVALQHRPGSFIVRGAPLAFIWPPDQVDAGLTAALNAVCILGSQRTLTQEAEFAIHQLVEVAVRALSPGINDPFTALNCIDWLGAALCRLCSRRLPEPYRYDAQGRLRVITPSVTFARYVESAFTQIYHYGHGSVTVAMRLLETIAVIGACTKTHEQRAVLIQQVEKIMWSCREGSVDPRDQTALALQSRVVLQALRKTRDEKDR